MALLLFVPSLAVASDTSKVNQSMISFEFRSSKAIDDQHRLLIDNFLGKIECIDLATFTQSWEKKFDFIYDIRIMNNPSKIIVIAKDRGKVMKITLSTEGKVLTQQEIVIPTVQTWMKQNKLVHISWSPPAPGSTEKLAVYSEGPVLIYEYPWKKPLSKIDVKIPPSSSYESVLTGEFELEWPYLIVQHEGGALVQVREFYSIYNAVTKKKVDILMDWNTSSDFMIEQGVLVVNSSSITPGPGGTLPAPGNLVYGRYDLATGKAIYEKRMVFHDNGTFWRTKYDRQQLLLMDSDTSTLTQLDQKGNVLSSVKMEKVWTYSGFLGSYRQNFILTKRSKDGIILERIPVKTGINDTERDQHRGNSFGNLNNGGFYASYGDWIYFNDFSSDGKMFKKKIDSSEIIKVNDDLYVQDINVTHDKLVYTSKSRLTSVNMDGTDKRILDTSAFHVSVVGDWIYYTKGAIQSGNIYRMKIDGSAKQMISDHSVSTLAVTENGIYYTIDFSKLMRMDLDGSNKKKLLTGSVTDVVAHDNRLYFNYNKQLYAMNLDGTQLTKISDHDARCMNIAGDWIYYSNHSDYSKKLYRVDVNGQREQELNTDKTFYIHIIGETLYYYDQVNKSYKEWIIPS